jgi:hypothetical protein
MSVSEWIDFSPYIPERKDKIQFLNCVDPLIKAATDNLSLRLKAAEELREDLGGRVGQATVPTVVRAACLVLADLIAHGWKCRIRNEVIEVARPSEADNLIKERERVQHQLHVERNRQLQSQSVREFVESMERRRLYDGRWISIFSLMRDGDELARHLRSFRTTAQGRCDSSDISKIISPYIQVIKGEESCERTGLRLIDIWRYFRHTWSNPYNSVPGRSCMILIRDAALEPHPVIGIGALASSAVQIAVRDSWIEWTADQQVENLRQKATAREVKWLVRLIKEGINELYLDDLLDPSLGLVTRPLLKSPTDDAIEKLYSYARKERDNHQRNADEAEHKRAAPKDSIDNKYWQTRAESPLFRGKRAETLAMLLRARALLSNRKKTLKAKELRKKLDSPLARQTLLSLIRRAKSERVGVAMADISVCGAIAPYSCLLGGKLVAMMLASPEIVVAYQKRYARAESIIASSMAGRPIIRTPKLVFLGTTSLYGAEPTQYTRVHIPCEEVGGKAGESIRYELLGRTEGFGTSQFSAETVEAMSVLLSQQEGGQRVHSIFGEGVNPRLRKIRDGLDSLGLDSDYLLAHGSPRLVYGVALARNFRDYLLGKQAQPEYFLPLKKPMESTEKIAAWWAKRWLIKRLQRDDVLTQLETHCMTHPIRHGARVPLIAKPHSTLSLFDDLTTCT